MAKLVNLWSISHTYVASRIRLRQLCEEHGTERLSLPLIACGLDGLKVMFILSYALSLSL